MSMPLLPSLPILRGRALLYTTTALTSLGFTLIGYDNGVMGGVINNPPFITTFNNPSTSLVGTIVAIYEVGAAVGSLICAVVGEYLGRRWSIFIGAIIMLGGAGFQAGVSSTGALIGARIVSGIGMGFLNSTNPVLQSEVSPKSARGRFVCFQLSCLNSGIMLAYWVGYGFTPISGSKAWRVPVAIQAVYILGILALIWFVPESPRWLASHDREDEALAVLVRLADTDENDEEVQATYTGILEAVQLQKAVGAGTWSDLLREDEVRSRRRLLTACSIQFFQQIGGINALNYFATNLVLATGLDLHESSLVAGGLFTWFFVASFIPWLLIDSVGRRKLLLACITGMVMCFAIEAGCVSAVEKTGSKAAGGAAVAFLFIYLGLFTVWLIPIGFQAIVWTYPSEILPLRLRQKGSAISTFCNWITNFAVVEMTPPGLQNIGYKFYVIFTIINASFLPVIYLYYPETKHLSLESIDRIFAIHPGAHQAELKPEVQHAEVAQSPRRVEKLLQGNPVQRSLQLQAQMKARRGRSAIDETV